MQERRRQGVGGADVIGDTEEWSGDIGGDGVPIHFFELICALRRMGQSAKPTRKRGVRMRARVVLMVA